MPARIQRKRTKGWPGMPPGAKYVGRGKGCLWGNPFIVGVDADDREHATALFQEWLENNSYDVHPPDSSPEHRQAMDDRRDWILTNLHKLTGRDLACWCAVPAPGQPDHCHGSVLLGLANPAPAGRSPGPGPTTDQPTEEAPVNSTEPAQPKPSPKPRQTRRDVSWSVMFRLARTQVWVEWSDGHRDPAEAIRAAEVLVPMESVADIRFDRVTRQRDMFSLHDLPEPNAASAAPGGTR